MYIITLENLIETNSAVLQEKHYFIDWSLFFKNMIGQIQTLS